MPKCAAPRARPWHMRTAQKEADEIDVLWPSATDHRRQLPLPADPPLLFGEKDELAR